MRALILIALALVAGCESMPGYYVRAGIGWQDDAQTDYWLQTQRPWQCRYNVPFDGELGYEFDHTPRWLDRAGVAYWHHSWLLCGSGLNDEAEVYANGLKVWGQLGGRQ